MTMQKLIYILPILFIVFSCEKPDCMLEEVTPITPIYYEYISPIRPVFQWEGVDNRVYILETSEYSNFEPLIESVEVTGDTYSSPRIYTEDRHIYWRLKTKGCENILIDEVFFTLPYSTILSGQYRSEDGGTVVTYSNNTLQIEGVSFRYFTLEKKTNNLLTFTTYLYDSSPMGVYWRWEGEINYNIDNKTLSAECLYVHNVNGEQSFSFKGKLIE
jgi:hypothetical protein